VPSREVGAAAFRRVRGEAKWMFVVISEQRAVPSHSGGSKSLHLIKITPSEATRRRRSSPIRIEGGRLSRHSRASGAGQWTRRAVSGGSRL